MTGELRQGTHRVVTWDPYSAVPDCDEDGVDAAHDDPTDEEVAEILMRFCREGDGTPASVKVPRKRPMVYPTIKSPPSAHGSLALDMKSCRVSKLSTSAKMLPFKKRPRLMTTPPQVPETLSAPDLHRDLTPAVHVLLSPGTPSNKRPILNFDLQQLTPTVCVMGLYGSGTHAMGEYLRRYFSVHVEPRPRQKRDGTVELGAGFKIWKHTVPLGDFLAPASGPGNSPVVVILTIREVRSWMTSLARNPYELYPIPKRTRHRGRVNWMFDKVHLDTTSDYYNPFQGCDFTSVPSLWTEYANGYLSGAMVGAGGHGPTYIIVRYEDIVRRPHAVVEELEQLGLRRTAKPFAPIDECIHGAGMGRTTLIENMCGNRIGDVFENVPELLQRLRGILGQHDWALAQLGYDLP